MSFYKHIDLEFDALKHAQSGYRDGNNFYHLNDMIKAIKEQWSKKERMYINSIRHTKRWDQWAMEMAETYKRIEKADLSIPIIVHRDGKVIDWYHRIVKAIIEKKKWIYAYRIDLTKVKYVEK